MIKPYFVDSAIRAISKITFGLVVGATIIISIISALVLVAVSIVTGNIVFIIPPVVIVILMVVFGL